MFAYCLNNPVNFLDSEGASAICVTNGDRSPLFIGYIGLGGGGGGGYGGSGNSGYKDIIEEISDKTNKALGAIGAAAEDCWDAYMRGYNIQQEAIMMHAKSNVDMFDSPEDIERSIDVIEATIGFSIASYEVAAIIIAPTPISIKAVAFAVGGLVWAARGVYRACQ